MSLQINSLPLDNFMYALKAPETKRKYPQRLKFFFDSVFPDIPDFKTQALEFVKYSNGNDQFVYSSFIDFIMIQNKRVDKKEITPGTVRNYYKAAKLFCEMNDIIVNWKKIAKGLLRERQYGDDRAPTSEELIQLMKYPDRRIRPIVLVMASSGIRAGAWDYLKWKHIIPIMLDGQVVAAKIIIYSGEPDEYYGFITGEIYGIYGLKFKYEDGWKKFLELCRKSKIPKSLEMMTKNMHRAILDKKLNSR